MRITYLCKFIKSQRALLRKEDDGQLVYMQLAQLERLCPFFYVGDSATIVQLPADKHNPIVVPLPTGRYKLILDTDDAIEVVPMIEYKQGESNEQYSLQG